MIRTALMAFTVLCAASGAFAQAELAPLRNQGVPGAIANRYIVVMKPGVSREAVGDFRQRITGIGGKVVHVYTSALSGFSVEISPEGVEALRALPGVDYIEVDQLGSGGTLQPPIRLARRPVASTALTGASCRSTAPTATARRAPV
jgi:Peptidase inhibitor I9